MEEKKTVYLTMHEKFVREGVEYTDRSTGERKAFNVVTLPKDTVVNGEDLSYYQFSPLFVDRSRFKGDEFRDIPLQAHKEVWLKKTVMGEDGRPVTDADGRQVKDVVKVMPADLRQAVEDGRSRYVASLGERAENARQGSRAVARGEAPSQGRRQQLAPDAAENLSRQDIPF